MTNKLLKQYIALRTELKNENYRLISGEDKECVEHNIKIYTDRITRIERYIDIVPDALTRSAMRLRYLKGESWAGVAAKLGGYNSEEGIRKRVIRYIDETPE